MVVFPEPTDRFDRAELLIAYLDFFRDTAVEKLRGVPAEHHARRTVPSGWNMLELLHHLIWAERRWVQWGFFGEDIGDPWGDRADGRWRLGPEADLDSLTATLTDQAAQTRAVVRGHRLDDLGAAGPRWRGAEPATLERVLLHLMQEWARHLGHLDIVVELAGGPTGKEYPATTDGLTEGHTNL